MSAAKQNALAEQFAAQEVALGDLQTQLSQLESALTVKTTQLTAEQDTAARAHSRADAADTQIVQWTAEAENLNKQVAELQVGSNPTPFPIFLLTTYDSTSATLTSLPPPTPPSLLPTTSPTPPPPSPSIPAHRN